jgi:hypothetical protein
MQQQGYTIISQKLNIEIKQISQKLPILKQFTTNGEMFWK